MVTVVVFYVICGAVLLLCVTLGILSLRALNQDRTSRWRLMVFGPLIAIMGLWSLISGTVLISRQPGMALFFPPGTVFFDSQGNKIGQVPSGKVLRAGLQPAGTHFVVGELSDQRHWSWEVGMAVTPITPNPKVRKLAYTVTVGTAVPDAAFADFLTVFGVPSKYSPMDYQIRERVQFLLYEFNEVHSKELAAFYNPLDPQQQQKFTELLRQYLAVELAKMGLTLESATFSLP